MIVGWVATKQGNAYEEPQRDWRAEMQRGGRVYIPVMPDVRVIATSIPTPVPTPAGVGVEDLICSVFEDSPYGCQFWVNLAACESTLRLDVDTNWPYIGLLQIDAELHAGLIAELGYSNEDVYSVLPNLRVGRELSHGGTYLGPWPECGG